MFVRGKYLVADPTLKNGVIEDGAVYIHGNRIVAVGKYSQLAERYPDEDEIGSDAYLILPGLINAHDHGRAPSAFQLGAADDFLETWLMVLMALKTVDPVVATAYAATQLIESGVTTVLHSYYDPNVASYESDLANTVKVYEQAGLRAVMALGILDESPISTLGEKLLPALPSELKSQFSDFLSQRTSIGIEDFLVLYHEWCQEYNGERSERINVLLGPVSAHWCSKELLLRIQKVAEVTGTGIQSHVLETIYQREQALTRHGKSAIAWLAEIGLLSPRLSCAHCVWVTGEDIDLLAEAGASVVHNPSSNLRLRSGIAPLNKMLERGVNVALGMDSHTLNDDGDMLQEMRLASTLHRVPRESSLPTSRQILTMATKSGAQALLLGKEVGVLEPGKKADLILLRLNTISWPFVDPRQDVLDMLLYRAKAKDVATVIIDGQLLMRDRQLLTLDKESIVAELQDQLRQTQDSGHEALAQLFSRIKPYVDLHYEDEGPLFLTPHYVVNSK